MGRKVEVGWSEGCVLTWERAEGRVSESVGTLAGPGWWW